jgi:branched-chain amino acid transport system substrate-binding protein
MAVASLRKGATIVVAAMAVALMATSCSNAKVTTSGGSGAPGVTSNSITVGSVATLSGTFASGFGDAVYGVKAYFDMINAEGGVNGRKIDFKYDLDDGGSATTDADEVRNLVAEDHVFAIVGVASPFFTSNVYLCSTGTPTFGYVVSDNWDNCPNLFGAYGSTLVYSTGQSQIGYLAKALHATSAAVLAYSIAPQSLDACESYIQGLEHFGITVGYQDLNLGYEADPTPDVQQMVAHHVDFVLTCTDGPENLKVAQTMTQYGLTNAHLIWLNGYDRTLVTQSGDIIPQDASILKGSIFSFQHVAFQAPQYYPGKYPGMAQYIKEMNKYEPAWTYDDISIQGWINAAQFVAGLKAAGSDLTQKNVVDAINKTDNFTAGGIMSPLDWPKSHTGTGPPPYCASWDEVISGGKLEPILPQNSDQILNCFNATSDVPLNPLPALVPPNS